MKKRILNLVSNRIARIGVLSLAIIFVAASCTEKEEMIPQESDSMMSITETLENYSEEIEFTELNDDGFSLSASIEKFLLSGLLS